MLLKGQKPEGQSCLRTILFIDEIHRFNRLQQDALFLPAVEEEEKLQAILKRALVEPAGFGKEDINCSDEVLRHIAKLSEGDARNGLNILELSLFISPEIDDKKTITIELMNEAVQNKSIYYNEQEHYNIIISNL